MRAGLLFQVTEKEGNSLPELVLVVGLVTQRSAHHQKLRCWRELRVTIL